MKQFVLPCCARSSYYGLQRWGPVPASGSWKPPAAVSCPLWRAHSQEGQAASSQSPPSHLRTPAGLGWQTSPRTSDAHTLQTSSAETEGDTQNRGEETRVEHYTIVSYLNTKHYFFLPGLVCDIRLLVIESCSRHMSRSLRQELRLSAGKQLVVVPYIHLLLWKTLQGRDR